MSPFNAHQFLLGHGNPADPAAAAFGERLAVARWLKTHPRVRWVVYPGLEDDPGHSLAARYLRKGFGGLVGFGIEGRTGGRAQVHQFGETAVASGEHRRCRGLVIHPASTASSD